MEEEALERYKDGLQTQKQAKQEIGEISHDGINHTQEKEKQELKTLQQNKLSSVIKKNLVEECLEMVAEEKMDPAEKKEKSTHTEDVTKSSSNDWENRLLAKRFSGEGSAAEQVSSRTWRCLQR